MELTNQQLNHIDQFLKDKCVKHLDLRMELTDHRASETEDLLKKQSIKTFEQAFEHIQVKYNVSILQDIRKNKERSMGDYWNKRSKDFWKAYFSFPKIAFTVALFLAFFSLRHIPFRDSSLLTMLNIILGSTGMVLALIVLIRSLFSKTRMIILESYAINLLTPYLGLQFVYQLETTGGFHPGQTIWFALLLGLSNAIFTIGLVGHFTSFRPWIKEELESTYPTLKTQ